ncbi:MAG: beta-ketoacyl-ACP synthase III [Bacillota bacterium]
MPELRRAGIIGLGTYVPERVLTNQDLERLVDTSDEWIRERTGIRERHIAAPHEATSDLGVVASARALADAGVDAADLDLIIVATATPDTVFPATACLIQDRLGAARAGAFDLAAGCSGFIYALSVASQFVSTGVYNCVLVVGAETLSRIVNWKDRTTCVLFGDGAGAAVVGPVEKGGILATRLGAHGSGGALLDLKAGGSRTPASAETVAQGLHYLQMNGREVFKFAVRVIPEVTSEVLALAGLKEEDIDLMIPHQANVRIIDAAAKRLQLSPDKILVNVDRYGNTSAASIPLALEEAVLTGRVKEGDHVVLVAFGAGLTWAAAVLEWNGK